MYMFYQEILSILLGLQVIMQGRIFRLVQAGHCDLSDRIFADYNPVSWTFNLHSARFAGSRNMPFGERSPEDSTDVRA